ncbi:lantibiotic immunity ABC transporter MutE/EpiE family permease subunit [Anaerobranca gottschalkii]|uniref:ABC-2 type transport system permease protein n=1 Tax=Anaerobranca gottschalkii DSM 13577 TaxID=1120990 RepID=A0A1I0C4Z0_9FIRM|nr:lantibiotic immunity ABC transporter MutE/EpiE family permease subunit [Anaerobranca gottschalkii]SET14592.1 ABC-2 type transport system permease protein [Anaerobranca gottschalkii DSM 13577]
MINVIKSESIKYRRTFTRQIILFAPLFFIIIALLQKIFMPANYLPPWQLLLCQVYNWWPVIFIPLNIALLAALVAVQEKKAGNYRNLRLHNISPLIIWISKIVLMAYHIMLATFVLIALIIISGFIVARREIPWIKIFAGGFTIWLTSLAVIPLQLWVATWKGTFFSMAVGFAGLISGIIAAPKYYWIYVPWSWATRLMCPIIGVHPNGVPLETSNPLSSPSVIPAGVALAIAALIIFTIITAVWFNRREVR